MVAASELHIIVPGLCGPLAEVASLKTNQYVKNWIKVLSKSSVYPSSLNLNDVITSLFNLSVQGDFPSAAFSMLAHANYKSDLNYMLADPVHLQADMDHAILTSSVDLQILDKEASVFCDSLNQHFAEDGLFFNKLDKDHWVVSSINDIKINTTPLCNAVGRNVNFILPTNDDLGFWKKTLNEAQMLMHISDINLERESAGKQNINSLWFHGSGDLPSFKGCNVTNICSDDNVLKGLAAHVGSRYMPLPKVVDDYVASLINNNHGVNVLHLSDIEHLVNYTDVTIWLAKLEEILDTWVYLLLEAAYKNNIKVIVHPCNNKHYQFSKYDSYKIWRQGAIEQHVSCY